MAAMCLHFEQAKDRTFEQYIDTFIEISVLPLIGEQVTVNGCQHIVTRVLLDEDNCCAQVYIADLEAGTFSSFHAKNRQPKHTTNNRASLMSPTIDRLH